MAPFWKRPRPDYFVDSHDRWQMINIHMPTNTASCFNGGNCTHAYILLFLWLQFPSNPCALLFPIKIWEESLQRFLISTPCWRWHRAAVARHSLGTSRESRGMMPKTFKKRMFMCFVFFNLFSWKISPLHFKIAFQESHIHAVCVGSIWK